MRTELRHMVLCAALMGAALVAPVQAKAALTLDISNDAIAVTTGFNGASLTAFGIQETQGALVIVVSGPNRDFTIHEKTRLFGLWTNGAGHNFTGVPSYYALASSTPLEDVAAPEKLRAEHIGFENIVPLPAEPAEAALTAPYAGALVRLQQARGIFGREAKTITYQTPALFKARFDLPPVVVPGSYTVRAMLFRDGQLRESASKNFDVVPTGLSARLLYFAHEHGFAYGLIGVFMALAAGWLANVLLKRE